ncbi:AraC family transcriptional regulator [Pseudomonas fluorescens]|uniref:Putative AraC-family transcriptional regulator n=1 Tax=Pseudomonas fluorescens (strain Pf0-1) TaxID=205922 RepID=Q3KBZ5_PSEPF|nr:AraC family transcriptional regulator [Pseudomonas fluorescens]ABA74710.1 putative AraC-family transcriptional regulator [Pseudomonas fluorescens Pf0-1]MBY9026278.1 AraC family transcriptional regulator [Pseudomonas fluorescens]MBY9030123.1 AraC family transcriptional regulator [Pseudomonas fluorescens]MBY9038096.1 AraC family transcriptional regulator [Pseudomonas fluorescens]MBY9044200.1 AraC family transcriptional regulator [Pseudomonas fluorescens]
MTLVIATSSHLLSERSSIFRDADPYAVSDYVNLHVGSHRIGLSRTTHPQASLNHRKFAGLDLCRISYGGSVRVTSPALESVYHLQVLLSGNCLWRGYQHEHYLLPGELLLINPDDPVDLTYSQDCEKFIVKLPVQLLESICDELRWLRPATGIRFLRNHYQLDELEGFLGLLAMICQESEASTPIMRVQEHYAQIVGSKLLSLMTTNVSREGAGSQSASFDRILDYIDRNLKQDLNAEHLAQQVSMSTRSLYVLFERHLGTTPLQYIRQRKLERIQACLSDPSCPVRSLTEVALDYGFLHLGRFSELYRSQFGELPSQTLKSRV